MSTKHAESKRRSEFYVGCKLAVESESWTTHLRARVRSAQRFTGAAIAGAFGNSYEAAQRSPLVPSHAHVAAALPELHGMEIAETQRDLHAEEFWIAAFDGTDHLVPANHAAYRRRQGRRHAVRKRRLRPGRSERAAKIRD